MNDPLFAHRGDDETYVFTVASNGTPSDLTGAQARFTAKGSSRDPDANAIIVKTTADGITISSPTTGEVTVVLSAADTADLTGTLYLYDLQISAGGKTSTVESGVLRVKRDISVTAP